MEERIYLMFYGKCRGTIVLGKRCRGMKAFVLVYGVRISMLVKNNRMFFSDKKVM